MQNARPTIDGSAVIIENLREGLAKELRPSRSPRLIVIKGGTLKLRGLEKFQQVFLEKMIKLLMKSSTEVTKIKAGWVSPEPETQLAKKRIVSTFMGLPNRLTIKT